ncbi:hypothetical protein AC1031_021441 [Aphanomyces cochlioides]|nr:hypothetical protein AC1031_021441 [Aphanomyces cochlioides]
MYEVNGSVNLLDFEAAMEKRYDTLDATTAIYPSYVRRVALTECNSIEFAVKNLRTASLPWLMYLPTQYCWVDLGRQFEIAHTDARQQRCIDQYKSNGAMYLETIFRNQVWADFMKSFGSPGSEFMVSIYYGLEETPAGQAWLATTSMARQSYSVAQEVAFWGSHNISSFMLQWQNCWQTGIQETLTIVNALGMTQSITLKKVAYEDETWTSYVLNSLFENDMLGMAGVNASLIWTASNSFKAVPGQFAIFRSFLGPFLSVDCFNVALPPSIVDLYRYFQSAIFGAIINDPALQKNFNDIRSTTHYPTPASWGADPPWMFYGGNIMCFNGSPQPFVQESFNFYDTCDEQVPLAVTSTKYSNLFATMAMSGKRDTSSICALQSSVDCSSNLEVAAALARKLVGLTVSLTPFVKRAIEDLQRLNVGLIQFAADQDAENWTLLRQGLLDDPDWTYFGWLMIYDWVEGKREVLSFEGDATTMRLISSADSPSQYPSNFDSLTSATRLIYYFVLYTSLILSAIVVASVIYMLCSRFKADGWNLFWFNRIVSSVWIGRPLMFLRGATAALLLSTTQLQTTASPYARFVVRQRPWYEISVLAGEATWILYIAHDLLSVVISRQYTASYCASGCMLAWSALIFLEFMWPVMPTSSISHDCSAVNLNFAIICSSGVLRLGSLAQVWLMFTIQVTALIFTLLVVGVKHYSNTMRRNMLSGLNWYSLGIADHFIFSKRQKHASFHDDVTCLMAGFVRMRWGSKVYIFDVKL